MTTRTRALLALFATLPLFLPAVPCVLLSAAGVLPGSLTVALPVALAALWLWRFLRLPRAAGAGG
ncbi:hypothetical protein [Streptomyces sp. I05A-00742]|uniref:hypothetical protein n=1 Tax=Streptomyces sp. I05A-00742 TaxID=2732853 RepID=UPI00148943CF|nr:hypothetical protein [Streptomyces sp. I05A-00742]